MLLSEVFKGTLEDFKYIATEHVVEDELKDELTAVLLRDDLDSRCDNFGIDNNNALSDLSLFKVLAILLYVCHNIRKQDKCGRHR